MFATLKAKVIALLFSTALLPVLARLCVALLGPVFRAIALPPAELKSLIGFLGGVTQTTPVLSTYTAAEVTEIGTTILSLLNAVITDFGLPLTEAQVKALLAAIANRLPATVV